MKHAGSSPLNRSSFLANLTRPGAAGRRAAAIRDAIRIPLQTAAAVLLAYASMSLLGLPAIAWGAFSALFVVRASVEGTIGEATGRVLGAFIGVAIGVGLVLLCRAAELPPAVGIASGVALAAGISMKWPMLSYSLVTVTILTVAPDREILAGAAEKALAIVIGSASGILAAVAILPVSARHNLRHSLADSIEAYGDVLVQCARALNERDPRPPVDGEAAMQRARLRAQEMQAQIRGFPLDALYRHTEAYRLYGHIERLWRTLALMDCASELSVSDRVCRHLGPGLDEVAAAAKARVDAVAQAVRRGERPASPPGVAAPLQRLDAMIGRALRERAFVEPEQEAVEVIRWAWHVVVRELEALAEAVGLQEPGAGRDEAAPA